MPDNKKDPPPSRGRAFRNWLTTRDALPFWIFALVVVPIMILWIGTYYYIPKSPDSDILVKDIQVDIPAGTIMDDSWDRNIAFNYSGMKIPDYDDFIRRSKEYNKIFFRVGEFGRELIYVAFSDTSHTYLIHRIKIRPPDIGWAYSYSQNAWKFNKEKAIMTIQYDLNYSGYVYCIYFFGTIIILLFGLPTAYALSGILPVTDMDGDRQFDNQNV